MKRKVFSILLLASSLAAAWLIGYLNFPLAISSTSFWMGCTAALAIISLTVLLYTVYFEKTWTFFNVRNVLLLLILTVLPLLIFFGHKSISLLEEHQRSAQRLKSEYSRRLTLLKNSSAQQQQLLFEATFEGLKQDLNIGKGTLSDSAIQKIVSFSASLKPYYPVNIDDSMLVSPERGKLLMGICQLPMDSNSFQQLIKKVDFSYADLRMKEFSNVNLDHIKLEYSNFEQSKLKNLSLKNAALNNMKLRNSKLSNSNLSGSFLVNTDLEWTVINKCILDKADLHDSKANNTQFLNTVCNKSNLKRIDLSGALLQNSQFISSDLMSSMFVNTTIIETDLSQSRIRNTTWLNTKVSGIKLEQLVVDENWLDETTMKQIDLINELRGTYATQMESQNHFPNESFILKRRSTNLSQ
ncbi:MAG: hypothetical protein CMO34_01930 [Verrucomicrobia bacterium]|nr:hypothetical protein [Verrucomicrobiota bacterium]